MNQEKTFGLIIATLVIGALGGYWYGHWTGDLAGYSRAQKELSARTQPPAATITSTTTNPLKNVKTNPFEGVKFNPFE